jgi:hypothetical protein
VLNGLGSRSEHRTSRKQRKIHPGGSAPVAAGYRLGRQGFVISRAPRWKLR